MKKLLLTEGTRSHVVSEHVDKLLGDERNGRFDAFTSLTLMNSSDKDLFIGLTSSSFFTLVEILCLQTSKWNFKASIEAKVVQQ